MSAEHVKHSDALDTLGTIIGPDLKRDAIHLAVYNAVAGEYLKPGTHVKLDNGLAVSSPKTKSVGIVDPFLTQKVAFGERFWLVIHPRQITSLTHVWEHPLFPPAAETAPEPRGINEAHAKAEAWLRSFADDVDAGYHEMMAVAATHCEGANTDWPDYLQDGGKWEGQGTPDEFWEHFKTVTGKAPKSPGGIFSCSC